MSQVKKFRFGIILLISLMSFFMFGCEKSTPVNDIFFNLGESEQIVLVVGQTLELDDYVSIKPNYATNKGYTISSLNDKCVKVENNKIVAVAEGSTQIKVVADENNLKQDLMTVIVKKTKTTLNAPVNLTFNRETQLFSFDMVSYATSYTFKINGTEIELGNSNIFDLNQYEGNKMDSLLYVQVKANAPTYTYALEDSQYSKEYKFYQAANASCVEIKNGILSFNKSRPNLNANIYLGEELFEEDTNLTNFELDALNELYAGLRSEISVQTIVSEEIKSQYGQDVQYFNGSKQTLDFNVLDVPILQTSLATLSWQNITYAAGYDIYLDDVKVAETKDNFLNLDGLNITASKISAIRVEPVVANTINVGKTTKTNSIKVSRLNKTVISCEGSKLTWTAVENAKSYSLKLVGNGVNYETATTLNSFSMETYNAGNYVLTIQAVAGSVEGQDVYYLSSQSVNKDFAKNEKVSAVIDMYYLNISNLGTSDCSVEFDKMTSYNATIEYSKKTESEKENETASINLGDYAKYNFTAGSHTITIIRKGCEVDEDIADEDIVDSVDSDPFEVTFTQLEEVTEFEIDGGVAKVVRSSNNQNANIALQVKGAKEFKIDNLQNNAYAFDTTSNSGSQEFLNAGNYTVEIYVIGDGEKTFSVRESGVDKVCATASFEVLKSPIVTLASTSESKLVIGKVTNANSYGVYSVSGATKTFEEETDILEWWFNLGDGGRVQYAVQAVGNGTTTLNSNYSDVITIERLQKPTLTYNNETEVVSKNEPNGELAPSCEFKVNGEVEPYDFVSKIHFAEDVTLSLKSLAISEKDNVYYLNSLPYELNLTKISNDVNFEMNDLSNLEIEHVGIYTEYDLEVVFTLASGELKLYSNNGVLTNGKTDTEKIELDYSHSGNKYTIELINNYNAIIDEMNQGFSVKVKFIEPSTGEDDLINSEYSKEDDLDLVKIDNTTTFEDVNNKQLVIKPANHNKQYGLVVVINDDEDLTFKSNGNKLVSNKGALSFEYNAISKAYYIDIVSNKYEYFISELSSTFTIKVQYTHLLDATSSDLDSEFTTNQTIEVIPVNNLIRENQTIKIDRTQKPTFTFVNFGLIVNNYDNLITFDSVDITENGNYLIFDLELIYSKTPGANLKEINEVKLVAFNDETVETKPELLSVSASIYVQKTNTITLNYSKNNDIESNSAVISFNTYTTVYEKEYVVQIHNGVTKVNEIIFEDTDASSGIIAFDLDDIVYNIIESGTEIDALTLSAIVRTGDDYIDENTIYVFNSISSNELVVDKVDEVGGITISNSILTFNIVENAVGYELYEKTGTGFTKLDIPMLTTNQYEFSNITEKTEIAIKAISNANNFTNSVYSETFVIDKIDNLVVKVENGVFKIELPNDVIPLLEIENVNVTLEIINHQSEVISVDLKNLPSGVSKNDNVITIQPELLLCYNSASLLAENIKAKIVVGYTEPIEDVYYLNSNVVNTTAYGLMEPSSVSKTTDDNKTVEFLTWTPSGKNVIGGASLSVGYVFRFEYDNKPYYSNDSKLKYYDGTNYLSYSQIITTNSVNFPVGYDNDADGDLDITFGAGIYKISVRAVPNNTNSSYNICYSKYSTICEFEILAKTTTLVEEGVLTWNAQEQTNQYKVNVYKGDAATPIVSEVVGNSQYAFSNNTLKNVYGVLRIVVQALGNRSDILNGQESEPIYVYRLREATSISFDDGNVILKASPIFTKAKIEFVDTSSTTTKFEKYYYNESASEAILKELNLTTWKGFSNSLIESYDYEFAINNYDEILNFFGGRDYSVNVTLYGNSNSDLGLINSSVAVTENPVTATKLKPSVISASQGVLEFMPDSDYATITNSVYKGENLNYVFNKTNASNFWKQTTVYKINLTLKASVVDIYAVDYYSLTTAIANSEISTDDYVILDQDDGLYAVVYYDYQFTDSDNITHKGTLHFNVYDKNTINLRDNGSLSYYPIEKVVDTEGFGYLKEVIKDGKTAVAEEIISLDGGMFEFKISILGGDSYVSSKQTIGYLNSNESNSELFIKYSSNTLSTYEGKVQFNNLVMVRDENGVAFDHPIYKLNVIPTQGDATVFYLYYEDEEMAREVAYAHDNSTYANAEFVKIEQVKDNEDILLFDLSQYVTHGTYTVNIRTLASNESEAGNFINAKEPGGNETNIYYMLSETQFKANDGALEFNLSYFLSDVTRKYYYSYEIDLYDVRSGVSYLYTINEASDGVKVDYSQNKITYTLPSQIIVDGKPVAIVPDREYEIKIRAKSIDEDIINGIYLKDENEDVVLTFKKLLGISEADGEKLCVENGVLKWKVLDLESYDSTVIRVSFLDENFQTKNIIIKNSTAVYDENGQYLYHYYDFTNERYNLETTGGAYIYDKITYHLENGTEEERPVNYTISIYLKGIIKEEIVTLNSNYSMIENIYRLSSVDKTSVKTNNGILTWDIIAEDIEKVEDVNYEITISGSNLDDTIKKISKTNSLDVLTEIGLDAGTYKVNIRPIATTLDRKINGRWLEEEIDEFIQLDKVNLSSVKIQGQNIVWDAVEYAQRYKVVFKYTDVEGNDQTITKDDLTEPVYEMPANKKGQFLIEISAISIGDEVKLFNGEKITFISTDSVPLPVENLEFDEETNTFVIDVNLTDPENPFTTGDKINLVYGFKAYNAISIDEYEKPITIEISYQEGVSRYYHQITEMGHYLGIYAQIVRANTSPSNSVVIDDIDYHLFAYGAGVFENVELGIKANPYRIANANQLLNIKYFPNANYELSQSIDISSIDFNAQLEEYGAVITSEFGGVLNGNGKAIVGNNNENLTIELENQIKFALFGKLTKINENNPTIKNLTIGSNDFDIILLNKFDEEFDFGGQKSVELSLIATTASNAIIDNVNIIRAKMIYEHNNSTSIKQDGSLYLATMFKEINNGTTITNSSVDVEINVNARIGENVFVYIAGVSANAISSKIGKSGDEEIDGVQVKFTLTTNNANNLFDYVGGIVATFEDNSSRSAGIKNSSVSFTVGNDENDTTKLSPRATYIGGLVASAKFATISNCKVSGTYEKANVNYDIYFGGLVGYAQNSVISDSDVLMIFNIKLTNATAKNIGAIAGYLSSSNNYSCEIRDCYYYDYNEEYEQTDLKSTNSQGYLTVGIYGNKTTNVIISGLRNEQ